MDHVRDRRRGTHRFPPAIQPQAMRRAGISYLFTFLLVILPASSLKSQAFSPLAYFCFLQNASSFASIAV
jgi:hypothetical protein